jgi:hypothetical protein
MRRRFPSLLLLLGLGAASAGRARADDELQVDVSKLLDCRPVTTLTAGHLVPWTQGVDGGGLADGFVTKAAAAALGSKGVVALPDNGFFPANDDHPRVQLHFTNTKESAPQAHALSGRGAFDLPVPRRAFSSLQFYLTSAEGPSNVRVVLRYYDGTSDTVDKVLPDYANAPSDADPDFFALAGNLGKWDSAGHLKEPNHHYLYGMTVHPDLDKALVGITVIKGAEGYLLFWGATGVYK